MSFLLLLVMKHFGEDKLPEIIGGALGAVTGSAVAFISWGMVFDMAWALLVAFLSGGAGVYGAHLLKRFLAKKQAKKGVK